MIKYFHGKLLVDCMRSKLLTICEVKNFLVAQCFHLGLIVAHIG